MLDRTPARPAHRANGSAVYRLRRRTRRLLVVATLAGFPGMYAWYAIWSGTTVSNLLWGPFSFVLLGLTFVGGVVLAIWARNRASLRDPSLDERERQVRDHAYATGYQLVAWVAVLSLVALALVTALVKPVLLTFDVLSPIVVAVAIYVPAAPHLVIAWNEADSPADEA